MRLYFLPLAAIVLTLSACANMATHESKMGNNISHASQGKLDEALTKINAHLQEGDKKDLLLNLEKAELLRVGSRYQDSLDAFSIADAKVNEWEAVAKSNPEQLLNQIGAVFMGDSSRTYEGQDYEKVMLSTRMAMVRMNLGDLDNARVDIKRTHEREAVIARFREKETEQAEAEAKEKGVTTDSKELSGYPIETLNDPEVLKLKNGFQNALSHYMAGFTYEALNEPGLAAPGYRKAIELRPNLPLLEEGLRGLDLRTSHRRPKGMTDVLFIVETGSAPARQSQKISFPVPVPSGLITVSFSFPAIYPNDEAISLAQLKLGNTAVKTELVTDFNVMARKALKDELPGIQARATVRAIGKGLIQDQANRQLGVFGGLIGNIVTAATEGEADDRMWRSLPERVFLARSFIKPGEYDLHIAEGSPVTQKLTVDGRYMVVPVRIFKTKTYFGEPVKFGNAGVAPTPVKKTVPAKKRPVKKKASS